MATEVDKLIDSIKTQITTFESSKNESEVGEVTEVRDGIAKLKGLDKCGSQEITYANEINIDKLASGLDNVLKVHILTILSDCQNLISK